MQAAERSRERRRAITLWASITAVVVAIGLAVGFVIVRERANRPTLEAVQSYTVTQGHVTTPVSYAQTPPLAGNTLPPG